MSVHDSVAIKSVAIQFVTCCHKMYCDKKMEWQWLAHQILLDHYELKDGVPTNGEFLLDALLDSIGKLCQRPLSDNLHSVFNNQHYIFYGGYL